MFSSILNSALSTLGFGALPAGFGFSIPKDSAESFQHGPFSVSPGTASKTGESVSIFFLSKSKRSLSEFELARNFVTRLKILRHPGALLYLESVETNQGIFLATERVVPFDSSSLSPDSKTLIVADLLEFIAFIHKEASIYHGGLNQGSLLLNSDGVIKVGGFFESNAVTNAELNFSRRDIPRVRGTHAGVIADLIDLMSLVQQLIGPNIPESWKAAHRDLLASRVDGEGFLQILKNSAFLKENRILETVRFLRNVQLHTDAVDRLVGLRVNELPTEIRKGVVVAALGKVLEVPALAAAATGVLTQVSKDFDGVEFKSRLWPLFAKLASLSDRGVRYNLLVGIGDFAGLLDRKDFEKYMFTDLTSGFTDSHPVIREHTVNASIHFAKKLKPSVIASKLMPHLARLLIDAEGLVRAASMKAIGEVVAEVSDLDGRVEILIQAVISALKDSYGATRVAAVDALNKSMTAFSEREVATALMPALSPHLLDAEIAVNVFDIFGRLFEKFRPTIESARALQGSRPAAQLVQLDKWTAQFPSNNVLSTPVAVVSTVQRASVSSVGSGRLPVTAPNPAPAQYSVPSLKDLDEDFWAELDKPSR